MLKKPVALLFVIIVVIIGCGTESSPAPFVPAKIDILAIEPRNKGLLDSQYPTLVAQWFLHLLSERELGSRESFHEFGMQNDSFLRTYDLDIAVNMIKSGTLPSWAEPYFVSPPDGSFAVFACAAHYDDGQNPHWWHAYGVEACTDDVPALWVTASKNGEQSSWAEFIVANPLGFADY
jgi:hypothetical protein